MGGAVPPLPDTPSWRGAQLKHRDNLPLSFKRNFIWTLFSHVMYENTGRK